MSEAEALFDAAFGIWSLKLKYGIYWELNPAIRSNLLLFKGKSKRISAPIGSMASVFKRTIEWKAAEKGAEN